VFGKLSIDVLVGKLKYYYTYIEKLIAYSPGVVGFVYVRKTNKNISQIEKNIPPYYKTIKVLIHNMIEEKAFQCLRKQ
jgi:hypothetical protein